MQTTVQQDVSQFPRFSEIKPESFETRLSDLLSAQERSLNQLLEQKHFTWENLMQPLAMMSMELHNLWSPFSHLHAVKESDALRAAYNVCLAKLTQHQIEFMHNEKLHQAVKSISESKGFAALDLPQKKVIEDLLTDLHLSGSDLPPHEKKEFAELEKQLSQLTTQFEENILDATDHFKFHITNEKRLRGLPKQTIELAAQCAKRHNQTGWLLTLDAPCYVAVMQHAEDRDLRQHIYKAYVTRASDQGPTAGEFDNSQVMKKIMNVRHHMAKLLGFKNYADYVLTKRMAKTTTEVFTFLHNLAKRTKPFAEEEMLELREFARDFEDRDSLEAWDIAYYSEKLRQKHFVFSHEELRPWFVAEKVVDGMFQFIQKLLGITITEQKNPDVWDPTVRFFVIHDASKHLRGYFYTDLYARPHKRSGAWMDDCRERQIRTDKTLQYPVAFLNCNFTPPIDQQPSLLTHEEVQTLFHEFGHCLHHLLTQVNEAAVAGIHGVPWDAVEFPSQLFENWCWHWDTIQMISSHVKTGEPLPMELFQKLVAAKNFQSAMQMARQLQFALFDFRLHTEWDATKSNQIQTILDEVRSEISVTPTPQFNRFQHSFSHIFAGGYAAGYYSYKWAEVLSSDAFSLFEEKGIFNPEVGQSLLNNILEQGGVVDPMTLFIAFRGRPPTVDALLRHCGLT
ncbi:MAG: M3 family metallopeptidase [Gammaproteobacteria bacterium]|nr:M3 family metallopeptidase [Gammaproteobacteria bacterium]